MPQTLTRSELLSRGAKSGVALTIAGAALGQYVGTAAADPLPTADLAYARLLVAAELLSSEFYGQALAAGATGHGLTKYLNRAKANEDAHYKSVAGILTGAGLTPATAGDIDFTFPKGTFQSAGSIAKFAAQLESTVLGAYLGAIGSMQSSSLKQGLAQIAASEAQHLSHFNFVLGRDAFLAFPTPLTIDQASNALDAYTA